MARDNLRFALNAIQWISVKEDPNDPDSANLWRYADPAFVAEYPDVLRAIRESGFDAAMMEVLDTQTLQSYAAMVREADLQLAPGYLQLPIPSDHGVRIRPGSPEWAHWFDLTRRRAEESNYCGLDTIFVAAEVNQTESGTRFTQQAAVGYDFRPDRLDEFVEILGTAAQILQAEGIHPGLHNHVGTWVETQNEIEYVLDQLGPDLLGASFDVGHLEWAGIDSPSYLAKWSDRLVDIHVKDLNLDLAREVRQHPTSYYQTVDRGLFLEPGLGQIDLGGVLDALPDGFGGWVIVEVDRATMDPVQSAKVSADWVARMRTGAAQ